ncbi:MAG: HAD-IIA family hydrolase [Acidimicrobiales bacterium]|nr:HAD-IIA family hydrolase [Acidimicrobiales bacterium]
MPVALDLDGVVWLADEPIAGSAEAIGQLRARGEEVVFVTNNSYFTRQEVAAKLAGHGICAENAVLTSAMAAARLVQPDETVLVVAGPGVVEALVERGANVVRDGDADAVVVGFHPDFDYEGMRVASRAVRGGARLIATNDDPTYPTPEGPIPGGGAIVASISTASGVAPVVAGKPYEPMVALVRERLGNQGWVIGDRPDTDGRFAQALGFRFGLVLSGVTAPADLPVVPSPDLIAGDLAELTRQLCD